MARRSIHGARALVTGASSGIGREIALELARQGARVLLTARREERLADLAADIEKLGGEAHLVAGDIASAELRGRLFDAAAERFAALDILVNNAGVGAFGPFEGAGEARLRRIMEINFFAAAETTRGALPLLKAGARPIIVNVSSVLGHRAVPGKSEYCASKFALHGFSDAIRAELAGQVDVLLVSPSTTQSEFFDSVLETAMERPRWSYGGMQPAAVARKAVRAIRRGSHEIILTPGGKALVWFDRLFPTLTDVLTARFG